jgi:predicted anti-sigma-YlaC factor YlaD
VAGIAAAPRTQGPVSCPHVVELVTDYLEGALHWADRARVEGHLEHCEPCRIYLQQMQQTIRWLGRLAAPTTRPAARQSCLELFRAWKRG